jgi:hypothetical protein
MVAVAALGVVSALAAGPAQAVSFNYAKITFASFDPGPLDGMVVAAPHKSKPRARVWASLHGLPLTKEGSGQFLLIASPQPCGDAIVFDTSVYRLTFTTGKSDAFRTARVGLRAPLRTARSVRLFERGDQGAGAQLACARSI